jgi:hypothetical protein
MEASNIHLTLAWVKSRLSDVEHFVTWGGDHPFTLQDDIVYGWPHTFFLNNTKLPPNVHDDLRFSSF